MNTTTNDTPLRRVLRIPLAAYRIFRSVVLNFLFILLVLFLLVGLFSGDSPEPILPESTLSLNLDGRIVEQRTITDPVDLLLMGEAGIGDEILLSELLDVIATAAEDEDIKAMLLRPGDLGPTSFSHLRQIAAALTAFKESGKPIYARAGSYGQGQYYLASHADEIMLNPMGIVGIEGFSAWQLYFSEALGKLGINAHIFRVGEYKAAVEPFERTDMSPEARDNNSRLFGGLWDAYVADVSAQRGLQPSAINDLLNNFGTVVEANDGDFAALALSQGLVDRVESSSDSRAYLEETLGDEDGDLRLVSYNRYRAAIPPSLPAGMFGGDNRIGVIIASGEIVGGEGGAGAIGSQTVVGLVRNAIDDEDLKGLVLRINSPGGSAFASEQIRSELQAFRDTGRPLVVSMGPVAASGGYWVAAPADQIWASPVTITGSIGIFSILPTFEQAFTTLGLSMDGIGTTALAGSAAESISRGMNPMLAQVLQSSTESGYDKFLALVAEARGMTPQQVDAIGQGRVWSGAEALEIGLVDNLGDLDEALAAAAELAGLEGYEDVLLQKPLSPTEELLQEIIQNATVRAIGSTIASWLAPTGIGDAADLATMDSLAGRGAFASAAAGTGLSPEYQAIAAQLQSTLTLPLRLNDPNRLYLHCLTCTTLQF